MLRNLYYILVGIFKFHIMKRDSFADSCIPMLRKGRCVCALSEVVLIKYFMETEFIVVMFTLKHV